MPAPTPSCPPAPPCHVEPSTLPRLWGHWPCHQDVRQAPADAQTVRKKSILGDHLHTPTHLLCKLRPRKAGQLVLRPGTTRSRNFQISFSPLIFPPWEGGRGQETQGAPQRGWGCGADGIWGLRHEYSITRPTLPPHSWARGRRAQAHAGPLTSKQEPFLHSPDPLNPSLFSF